MRTKEQINLLMDDAAFFKQVHSIISKEDMKWKFPDGIRIPTSDEIKHNAKLILEKLAASDENDAIITVGKFEASKQEGILQLRFVLACTNPLEHMFGR